MDSTTPLKQAKGLGSAMIDHIMNSKQFQDFAEARRKQGQIEIKQTGGIKTISDPVETETSSYQKNVMQELAAMAADEAKQIAEYVSNGSGKDPADDTIDPPMKKQEDKPVENPPAQQTKTQDDGLGEQSIVIERFVKKNPETWGFNGIAGMDDLKTELLESFIGPLNFKFMAEKMKKEMDSVDMDEKKKALYTKIYEEYEKYKVSIPTGLLFYGPPGTGKTFITKKLAEEMNCGFVKKSMGEMGSTYAHGTTKNIKAFFDQVKKAAENEIIIMFLDEIDSLVSTRTSNSDAHKAEEVSQFLQEFNSLAECQNLIVIAATNRPDNLDSAILRSGRFDKKVYIMPPDFKAREEMFKIYIEKEGRPHGKLDYAKLAELTDGYVSADIEAICDEVSRDTSKHLIDLAGMMDTASMEDVEKKFKKAKSGISMKGLETAIKGTTSSLKMVDKSIYENWLAKIK